MFIVSQTEKEIIREIKEALPTTGGSISKQKMREVDGYRNKPYVYGYITKKKSDIKELIEYFQDEFKTKNKQQQLERWEKLYRNWIERTSPPD